MYGMCQCDGIDAYTILYAAYFEQQTSVFLFIFFYIVSSIVILMKIKQKVLETAKAHTLYYAMISVSNRFLLIQCHNTMYVFEI